MTTALVAGGTALAVHQVAPVMAILAGTLAGLALAVATTPAEERR